MLVLRVCGLRVNLAVTGFGTMLLVVGSRVFLNSRMSPLHGIDSSVEVAGWSGGAGHAQYAHTDVGQCAPGGGHRPRGH